MSKYMLNDRKVEVDGISGTDVDAYIQKAYYMDTGIDLTEAELEQLVIENAQAFDEDLLNKAIMAAEYAFEGDR